jgi:hypothetical protein
MSQREHLERDGRSPSENFSTKEEYHEKESDRHFYNRFDGSIFQRTRLGEPVGSRAGSIHGRVVDPQGAIIPNVKVTIEQIGTQISRSTTTGSEGLYTFVNLNVGIYNVTAEVPGFKKVVVPDVKVEVAQRVQLDLNLEIGTVAETLEVSAAPRSYKHPTRKLAGWWRARRFPISP